MIDQLKTQLSRFSFVVVALLGQITFAEDAMEVRIDCSRPSRGFIESTCLIPINESDQPQTIALWYPKWVPGSHGPGGPIANLAGMKVIDQNGTLLSWKRTGGEVYRIEVDVPQKTTELKIELRYITNQPTTTSFGHDCFFSKTLGVISPSCLIFYPEGIDADRDTVSTAVKLPQNWRAATALRCSVDLDAKSNGSTSNTIQYESVSFRVLLDSPVMAGLHYQSFVLAEGSDITPPHELHVFGDTAKELALNEEVLNKYRAMVHQTSLLMKNHPFDRFDILLGISSRLPKNGLEHSRSTFNILTPSSLKSLGSLKGWDRLLIPHEYLHAWCGKYRRPVGMVKSDFHTAKDTELLWVYEGLTQYLGELVEARCGLMTPAEFESRLYVELRNAVHQDGRRWRSLADTGAASHILRAGSDRWGELRRSQDYYMEGMLFWLEVDARLRGISDGMVTLDDFCHRFFEVEEPLVSPKGFDRQEVVSILTELADFDWDGLVRRRIESIQESYQPEVASLLGYRFELASEKPTIPANTFRYRSGADYLDSIGLVISRDGVISRVKLGSAADRADLVPGDKIVSLGERVWSVEALNEEISQSSKTRSVGLTVTDGETVRDVSLDYSGGPKHYSLRLNEEGVSLLSRILKAH